VTEKKEETFAVLRNLWFKEQQTSCPKSKLEKYDILGTKREVSEAAKQVLYSKEDQEKLGTNERTIMFKTLLHKKFEILPLSLEDEVKLDNMNNPEVLIQKSKFNISNTPCVISLQL
jgi:hypothetical protein